MRIETPNVVVEIEFRWFALLDGFPNLRRAFVSFDLQITKDGFLLTNAAMRSVISGETIEKALVATISLATAVTRNLIEGLGNPGREYVGDKGGMVLGKFRSSEHRR